MFPQSTAEMTKEWHSNPRWFGTKRPYTSQQVAKLRGSIHVEHTLARVGAERLWYLLRHEDYVAALGALTGNQAVQQVQAGLKAIYLSGWQVAADANDSGHMYPDQSLYPVDSVPNVIRRISNALMRADQIHHMNGKNGVYWMAPIIADAEAGFGGALNAFELMKMMIEAGAAAVHFEDQLSSAKKCGHLGGKVLVPTSEAIQKLVAARLAADVFGVPTLIIARTDANSAHLLLAYNCSPSFNWRKKLDDATIAAFQSELAEMDYKFQFVTLAGFHALNLSMFELARGYKDTGMTAYARLQEKEFSREAEYGYQAVKHQNFVGTGYFDALTQVIAGGVASTVALKGSTEEEQFAEIKKQMRPKRGPDAACQPILGDCPSDPFVSEILPAQEESLLPSGD